MDRSKAGFAFTVSALTALVVGSLSAPVAASSRCDGLAGCERKFCEIETQIVNAEKQANADKVAGYQKKIADEITELEALQKALSEF